MTFHTYGESVRIPRNEHVDIFIRKVRLNTDAPEDAQVEGIEIREFIKEGEVFGHGVVFPSHMSRDIRLALERVGE